MAASWLDRYFQPHIVEDEGTAVPQRGALNVTGLGVTLTDDVANDRTTIAIDTANVDADDVRIGSSNDHRVLTRVRRIQTTNAVIVTADTFAMPSDTTADFVVTVLARKEGSNDTFRTDLRVAYARTGGAPAIQGALVSSATVTTGTLGAATATIDLDGNDVRVRVTGVAATLVTWSVLMRVAQVQ